MKLSDLMPKWNVWWVVVLVLQLIMIMTWFIGPTPLYLSLIHI